MKYKMNKLISTIKIPFWKSKEEYNLDIYPIGNVTTLNFFHYLMLENKEVFINRK